MTNTAQSTSNVVNVDQLIKLCNDVQQTSPVLSIIANQVPGTLESVD